MPLYSLRNQQKFDLVNQRGKKFSSPHFITIIARNFNLIKVDCDNPTFLGMKVNKKISKRANVRNKIKRRIRHLMRLMLHEEELELSKVAVIFVAYKNFDQVEFAQLSFHLKRILKASQSAAAGRIFSARSAPLSGKSSGFPRGSST